jgi:hypothetical protein
VIVPAEPYAYATAYLRTRDRSRVEGLVTRVTSEGQGASFVSFDVHPSDDSHVSTDDPDFVRWPLLIDVEATSVESRATVVQCLTRFLTLAWAEDLPTVVACDFEDELPWSGGIARTM